MTPDQDCPWYTIQQPRTIGISKERIGVVPIQPEVIAVLMSICRQNEDLIRILTNPMWVIGGKKGEGK